MKKIIIHVGLQKTASTYLQEKVFPTISDVSYIGRPYTQENNAFNTLQYADDALYDPNLLQNEIERIQNKSNGKNILISDELFSGYAFWGFSNRGSIANRLSQIIPEAEIIIYIRNQIDLINSLYNQYVKTKKYDKPLQTEFIHGPGSNFDLDDWVKGQRDWNIHRRRFKHRSLFSVEIFRYSLILKLYKRLFSKVHLFLYEDFRDDPLTQIKRLESILETQINIISKESKSTNQGLAESNLKYMLLENKITRVLGPSKSKLRQFFVKSATKLYKDQSDSERIEYIRNLLTESNIFNDNKRLIEWLPKGSTSLDKYYLQ